MNLIKLLCVIGTRPEAIKMSPLINLLKSDDNFQVSVLTTGQHTDMLMQALAFFNIKPDYDLNIMRERQSLGYITSAVLTGTGNYLDENNQDIVLVHGDTQLLQQRLQLSTVKFRSAMLKPACAARIFICRSLKR